MRELDHKEGWALENWCFWIVVLEKTLESPCKEIKPVNPKGNQPWIFIGRTNAKAKPPILWPRDVKSWLTEKGPDSGRDWGQEQEATEDEAVEWHHQLNGHECEQTLGDGEGQGSLTCCSSWGCKESDTTEWLNNYSGDSLTFPNFRSKIPKKAESLKIQPGLKSAYCLTFLWIPNKSSLLANLLAQWMPSGSAVLGVFLKIIWLLKIIAKCSIFI